MVRKFFDISPLSGGHLCPASSICVGIWLFQPIKQGRSNVWLPTLGHKRPTSWSWHKLSDSPEAAMLWGTPGLHEETICRCSSQHTFPLSHPSSVSKHVSWRCFQVRLAPSFCVIFCLQGLPAMVPDSMEQRQTVPTLPCLNSHQTKSGVIFFWLINWLHQVLVAAYRILHGSAWALRLLLVGSVVAASGLSSCGLQTPELMSFSSCHK